MNALIRSAIIAGVAGLPALGVLGLHLNCSPMDFWKTGQEAEELQQLERATFRRSESRQDAVRQWIARRCTLAEVLTRFAELDREWPDYTTGMAEKWSDDSRRYQQLLSTVQIVLQGRPEELAAALRRLDEEYHALPAVSGQLRPSCCRRLEEEYHSFRAAPKGQR
jgi:hypothetical protein